MSDFVGIESPGRDDPFRSRRGKPYKTLGFTNNFARFNGPRGVYRFEAISPDPAATQVADVFLAVGKDEQNHHFPPVVSRTTCRAEVLPLSGRIRISGAGDWSNSVSAVELDVESQEVVWFWCSTGNAIIKIVRVGDLPPRDPEVSDRER